MWNMVMATSAAALTVCHQRCSLHISSGDADTWKSDKPAPQVTLAKMCEMLADKVMSSAQQGCLAQDTSSNRLTINIDININRLTINIKLVIQAAQTMTAFQSATAPDSTMPETGNACYVHI